MRMLFSCLPGFGTLHPLMRLALATQKAGHDVAFATEIRTRSTLERFGLSLYAVGKGFRELVRERYPELVSWDQETRAFRERVVMAGIRVEVTLPGILETCKTWHPDIVVGGHNYYGAFLAAEEIGIPHVVVEEWPTGLLTSYKDNISEPLNNWRHLRGLPPDPALEMLHRYLVLAPFPPSLRDPGTPLQHTAPYKTAYFQRVGGRDAT